MKVKIIKKHGEDIRAGQYLAYDDGIYRGVFQLMGRDKRTWWRGYKGYDWLKLIVR